MAAEMKNAFKDAKKKIDERNQPLPEGEYIAKLQSCSINKSKSSDNQYIGLSYLIIEGEEKGRTIYDNSLILVPEKADFIMGFFNRFGFDVDAIIDDEDGSIMKQYCEEIHQAAPTVKIISKHNVSTKDPDVVYHNVYLNKILDFDGGSSSSSLADEDNQVAVDQDDQNTTIEDDGLDGLDKKELRTIIMDDDALDIGGKFIASHTEEEIVQEIRDQRTAATAAAMEVEDPNADAVVDNEDLRQRLLTLCQSQGIKEVKSNFTIDQIKTIIYDAETGSGYTFDTTGDEALTEEEIATLIDAGLDMQINEAPKPEPVKTKAKTTGAITSNKKAPNFPAKKGGRK